jgi:hypothetical protein
MLSHESQLHKEISGNVSIRGQGPAGAGYRPLIVDALFEQLMLQF